MIDEQLLEQLRQQTDLYTVVSRFVELKKVGADFFGLCPFHTETTASFTVSPGKRFFHCFGCNAHGDGIDFLMRHRGLDFADAVQELAAEAGLVVNRAKGKKQPLRPTARFRPAPAPKTGHEPLDARQLQLLEEWQRALPGGPGEDYLRKRAIPLAVAQELGAGFLAAGQTMGEHAYGPRVVFPHQLPGGQVVNLYGRTINDDDKKMRHRHLPRAKGLLNAAALELPGELWIVEGPFDAAALIAAGRRKAVAVFGLDGFDWRWLGKHDLVIATDHDDAGQANAQRLLEEAAYRGLKARRLPEQALGGHKDVAAAWAAGVLDVGPAETAAPQVETLRLVEALGDPPERYLAAGWGGFRAFAVRFATLHLADALAAGWTLEELFSLPSSRLGGDAGAVWTLSSFRCQAVEITSDAIVLVAVDGARLTHRRGQVTGHLPWRSRDNET